MSATLFARLLKLFVEILKHAGIATPPLSKIDCSRVVRAFVVGCPEEIDRFWETPP
jgi:hypothetical protein